MHTPNAGSYGNCYHDLMQLCMQCKASSTVDKISVVSYMVKVCTVLIIKCPLIHLPTICLSSSSRTRNIQRTSYRLFTSLEMCKVVTYSVNVIKTMQWMQFPQTKKKNYTYSWRVVYRLLVSAERLNRKKKWRKKNKEKILFYFLLLG